MIFAIALACAPADPGTDTGPVDLADVTTEPAMVSVSMQNPLACDGANDRREVDATLWHVVFTNTTDTRLDVDGMAPDYDALFIEAYSGGGDPGVVFDVAFRYSDRIVYAHDSITVEVQAVGYCNREALALGLHTFAPVLTIAGVDYPVAVALVIEP